MPDEPRPTKVKTLAVRTDYEFGDVEWVNATTADALAFLGLTVDHLSRLALAATMGAGTRRWDHPVFHEARAEGDVAAIKAVAVVLDRLGEEVKP
ncbi:MAG: hypothetical protein H0U69_03480 [Trueperaceae bacterium]|nr:hypothetical protein [Trueperaceae bacterium]